MRMVKHNLHTSVKQTNKNATWKTQNVYQFRYLSTTKICLLSINILTFMKSK